MADVRRSPGQASQPGLAPGSFQQENVFLSIANFGGARGQAIPAGQTWLTRSRPSAPLPIPIHGFTSLRTYGFTVMQCELPLQGLQGVDMVRMVGVYGFTGLHSYSSLTLFTWSRSSHPSRVHQSAGLRVCTGTMLAAFTRGRHGLRGLGLPVDEAYSFTFLTLCHPSPYMGLRITSCTRPTWLTWLARFTLAT